ncbi:MAG: hypothetical protein JWN14_1007 [Chthonomonadales bacterium]|nr:hypothetical protein [Chthonomonadales bacterium]
MVTPNGPACDHCHAPLRGRRFHCDFSFTHLVYCTPGCLAAAKDERRRRMRSQVFSFRKHGRRFWKVVDGNDDLVCVTVYKKGAKEVIRRLSLRRPPPFHPATGASLMFITHSKAPSASVQPLYVQKSAKAA